MSALPGFAQPRFSIRYDHALGGWFVHDGQARVTTEPATKREALRAAQRLVKENAR